MINFSKQNVKRFEKLAAQMFVKQILVVFRNIFFSRFSLNFWLWFLFFFLSLFINFDRTFVCYHADDEINATKSKQNVNQPRKNAGLKAKKSGDKVILQKPNQKPIYWAKHGQNESYQSEHNNSFLVIIWKIFKKTQILE